MTTDTPEYYAALAIDNTARCNHRTVSFGHGCKVCIVAQIESAIQAAVEAEREVCMKGIKKFQRQCEDQFRETGEEIYRHYAIAHKLGVLEIRSRGNHL